MARIRVLILLLTILVVGVMGSVAIAYARGFRLDLTGDKVTLGPTGLLVANSDPTAAQVFVDGKLETATDNTISLSPGTYEISVRKEGYLTWDKTITIEQETVTQIDAFLIPSAPSLTAMTFSGVVSPQVSSDNTKIAYIVPVSESVDEKAGLWVIESVNLPLGFNRDPRQVMAGDLEKATFEFSPDGREILLTSGTVTYLLDISTFTPQAELVDITLQVEDIKEEWQEEAERKIAARLSQLPDEIESVFRDNTTDIKFSPDENRILYTASGSATLASDLVRKLPGSSTQKEEREIQDGKLYVYDIREDKNFKVSDSIPVYWLPNSLNLVRPLEDKIEILDYDGTNAKTIYSGVYDFPHAYATTSADRIIVLTSFSRQESLYGNLYWIGLK